MIDTGSKGFLSGTQGQANPHAGGGAQNAARSLGSIGRALSQAGADGIDVVNKIQLANNAKMENDTLNFWEEKFGQHEAETMAIKDPQARVEKMESLLGSLKSEGYQDKTMPKVVRDRLESQWGRIATKYRNRALSQSAQLMIDQARTSMGTRLDRAKLGGTMEDVRDILSDGMAQGVLSKADADALDFKMGLEIQNRDLESFRAEDPKDLLSRLQGGEFELDKLSRQRQIEKTERAVKVQTRELILQETNDVLNGIAEGDIGEKDIEARTPNMGAFERTKLYNYLRDSRDKKKRELMKSPAEQHRVTGKLAQMIENYDGEGGRYTEDVTEMQILADQLSSPRDKERYLGMIKEKIEGRKAEVKTVSDWGFKQISEIAEAGMLGKVDKVKKKKRTVRDHIKDGFFDDTEKLLSLGFSADQAKEIQEAEDDLDGIAWDDEVVTPGARADKFKELWENREGDVTADQDAVALANDVAKGRDSLDKFHSTTDDPDSVLAVESQKRALQVARGKLEREFSEWIKLRPKATLDDVEKQLELMNVDIQAGETNADWRAPRPSFGESGATSLNLPSPLQQHSQAFEHYGEKYGVDPRFLAAISQLETANGTSSAFRKKRNLMGVSNAKGPISFNSPAASVERMARVLASKNGPYRNATTLAEIAAIYAPPGAGNDPKGTNGYWPTGVRKYLKEQGVSDPDSLQLIARF